VKIAPGHFGVVGLAFVLPRAARGRASLFYRPADSAGSGSIPLGRRATATPRALSSATTLNTFWATAGVGDPWGTAVDGSGNVWFAEPGCDFAPTCSASARPGQIGVLKAASHTIAFYTLPNIPGNQPIFLAFDQSGKLWFTTPNNSMIGEFNPSTGQFVGQWPVTSGTGPWDLTFVGDQIWYTEHLVSAVGSFDTSTHAYRDFQTPTANSNPYGIAADGGLIWFTENNSSVDRIASLDTRNNAISEYPIVKPVSGTPHEVAIDRAGHPWWTEGWSNTVATLNPGVATPGQCGTTSGPCTGIQRFKAPAPTTCSTSGSHTSGIAFQGGSGLVWFDNSLTAQVGSLNPSGNAFAMTSLSSCGAHPHDGLSLDAAGNVWFDEEFANAIGEQVAPAPSTPGPTVVTGSASAVGTGSATVAGTVDPNGQTTTYHFEFGLSTSYGSQAPAPPDPSAGSGATSQSVSANLTGLSPGTTYHYRLVATNVSGIQYGSDRTFATATTSPPTITSISPASGAVGATVTIGGANFTGATAVAFNGTAAGYAVGSANQITATVPAGATSGPISVTTPAGTTTSSGSFTVVPAGAVLAADSFNRSVTGGWGVADVGGTWTLVDTPTSWSVTPGAGSVRVAAGAQARAVLGGVSVQDVDLLARLVLPMCTGGTNCDSFLVGRYTGDATPTYYRVGAVQGPGSSVYLRAQRDDGTYLVNDLNTGVPAAAGVVLWVRVQFQGVKPTTIRARVWPAGTAEPSTWLLNTSDSTAAEQTAGAVGLRARNEDWSAARSFQFQSYQASTLP
jgi:streptogramin lyase